MANGEVSEHTFQLNNVNRTWKEPRGNMTRYVTVCSCGETLSAYGQSDLSRMMVEHIDEKAKEASRGVSR